MRRATKGWRDGGKISKLGKVRQPLVQYRLKYMPRNSPASLLTTHSIGSAAPGQLFGTVGQRFRHTRGSGGGTMQTTCFRIPLAQPTVSRGRAACHAVAQQTQEQHRPHTRPTTGRRRGKALLRDVNLKPGEKDDPVLEQITRDLLNSEVEVRLPARAGSGAGGRRRLALAGRACWLAGSACLWWHAVAAPV